MAQLSFPPVEEARTIFNRLGYSVSGDGPELRAQRKWRTVHITAMGTDADATTKTLEPGESKRELRCFVTWEDYSLPLREKLRRKRPGYDWAIIAVDDHGDYEVVH
ncbi:MAG: DUF7116 family protein [Halobacteriota archaeon]